MESGDKGYPFFAMLSRMRYINRWGLMRNTRSENIQEHSLMAAIIAHALALIRNKYYGGGVDADRVAVVAMFHDCDEILTGDLPTPVKYFNESILNAYREVEHAAKDRLLSMLPEDIRPDYHVLMYCEGGDHGRGSDDHIRVTGGVDANGVTTVVSVDANGVTTAVSGDADGVTTAVGGDANCVTTVVGGNSDGVTIAVGGDADGFTASVDNDSGIWPLVKAADTICAYIKCLEELAGGNTEFATAAKSVRAKLDAIELPEVKRFLRDYIGAFSLTLDDYGI